MIEAEEERHDTREMDADEIRKALADMDRTSTMPPPELVHTLLEAQLVPEPPATGEPCPLCATCMVCGGCNVVTRARLDEWAAEQVSHDTAILEAK